MTRSRNAYVKNRKRNERLKLSKGFFLKTRNCNKLAQRAILNKLRYSYIGRKIKKREMRCNNIATIAAACKSINTSYSKFMGQIQKSQINLDRRALSTLAQNNMMGFKQLATNVSN